MSRAAVISSMDWHESRLIQSETVSFSLLLSPVAERTAAAVTAFAQPSAQSTGKTRRGSESGLELEECTLNFSFFITRGHQ